MADLIFRHLAGADGEGVYKNGKTGFSVSYFKKKEIDSRYPSGGYMVVGQIGKGKREIGNLQSDDGQTEKVYAATKMPHTAVVGYIETEADKFIAIVKDRLLLWLLFALLIAALIIGLIFLFKGRYTDRRRWRNHNAPRRRNRPKCRFGRGRNLDSR